MALVPYNTCSRFANVHWLLTVQKRKLLNHVDKAAVRAMEQVFDEADTDQDQSITADEFEAWCAVRGDKSVQPWLSALASAARDT